MLDIASNRIKKIENVSHLTELQEFWVSLTPPLGCVEWGRGARWAWCAAALGAWLVGPDTGLGCGRSAEPHLGASQNEEQTGPATGRGRVGGCASEVGVPLRAL